MTFDERLKIRDGDQYSPRRFAFALLAWELDNRQ
jgi:hypothetical protein